MKRLLTLIVVLGLVAGGTRVANAIALTNGLLDATSLELPSPPGQVLATPTSWHVAASRSISGVFTDGASSEGFANVAAAGGSGLFFKPFTGNSTDGNVTAHLYQDQPGSPGVQYTLTGWAGAAPFYVGVDPINLVTRSELAIDFDNDNNIDNGVLGSAVLDLKAAGLGTLGLPGPFGYAQYSISGTSPAGTSVVRSRASMINAFGNPLGGDQAYVVDVFELTAVPEPATAALGLLGVLAMLGLARRR